MINFILPGDFYSLSADSRRREKLTSVGRFGEGGRLRGKFAAFPAFRALRLAGGERGNIMEEGPSGPGIGPARKGQNFSGPDGPNRRFL